MRLLKSRLGLRLGAAALLLASSFGASAQTATPGCDNPPNCIVNPDLSAGGGGGDMNTGPGTYVNGWSISHGTPTLWAPGPGAGPNAIWMWSYSGDGEGIYSCFNFQAGHTYRICLWVENTNGVSGGNLNLYAATGLTGGSGGIPVPTTSELISDSYTWNTPNNWTQVSYLYTPDDDYSQLWVYPYRADGPINDQQYELAVDNIHVFEIPNPEQPIVVCAGDPLVLPGAGCGGYTWYDPSGNYLGAGPIVYAHADPSMEGPYTVVYGEGDCKGKTVMQVKVNKDCGPCDDFKADFKVKGCNPVSFTDVSSGPGSSVAWFWDFGDGYSSNLSHPVHTYANPGGYTVCLTVIRRAGGKTCCRQVCRDIKVCDPPKGGSDEGRGIGDDNESSFRYESLGGGSKTLRFQDAVVGDDILCGYQWDFGDGVTSSLPNPAHHYAKSGTYVVTLSVTSCGNDAGGTLVKGFTNTYRRTVVVEGPAAKAGIAVVPNPASTVATVKVKNMGNVQVSLRDLHGRKVAAGRDNGDGSYSIDLQGLSSGMYMVTVDGDKGQFVQKLVKQ